MRSKSKREQSRQARKLKEIHYLNVFSFVIVLVVFLLGSIILPKQTVSEAEKRELSKFPSFSIEDFFNGAYFAQIDSFYSDTFPLRDTFLNVSSQLDEIKGLRDGEEEIKIYNVKN